MKLDLHLCLALAVLPFVLGAAAWYPEDAALSAARPQEVDGPPPVLGSPEEVQPFVGCGLLPGP